MREGSYSVIAPILLNKRLIVRGGFKKTEAFLAERSSESHTSINGNKAVGCMRITEDAYIDNFVFDNGNSAQGGGVNSTAAIKLDNCIFSNCNADSGGGLYSTKSLDLIQCTFVKNYASGGSGGAIFIQGSDSNRASLTVRNSQFEENVSNYDLFTHGEQYGGGAIYSTFSHSVILSNSDFINNWGFNGGAIYIANGDTASIEACRFEKNNARQPAGQGGGIFVENCLLQVSDSDFVNNNSADGGALYANPSSRISNGISVISNSTFHDNGSADDGAAVHLIEGKIKILNCLFHSNSGNCAGAVCAKDTASLDLVNSTIVDNIGHIGGVSATQFTSVVNSILWDNRSSSSDPNLSQVSTEVKVSHSNVNQDDFDGVNGSIRITPGFVNAAERNYRLADGSPCVDNGDSEAQFLPSNDLDGNARIIGSSVDMGAYEKP